jgi:N-acetylneuraminic acid mutarotase
MNPVKTLLSTLVRSRLFIVLALGALTVLPAVPTLAAGSGTWTVTGSMHVAREDATATLLQSGQVLVVGSESASAELYNPATGSWTTTGSMHTPHNAASATLLQSGQVLVAGGSDSIGPLASAELYNSATGTWTVTGSMHSARYQHNAVLLANRQVLVSGGYNENSSPPYLTSAELYNPATGSWTTTGSMHSARDYDTMTLLQSGQVLVTGGYNITSTINILASAELYNPVKGTWTLTKSMHTARTGHAAALLASGQVLVAAGESSSSFLTSAELYNPASGTWTSTGSLHAARDQHTATLLANGQVLVAGGLDSNYNYLASAELYTP